MNLYKISNGTIITDLIHNLSIRANQRGLRQTSLYKLPEHNIMWACQHQYIESAVTLSNKHLKLISFLQQRQNARFSNMIVQTI